MNEQLKALLPNPFAVDYQYNGHAPLDLYTETEMLKFALAIVKECAKVIDDHYEPVYDGNFLKDHFGVE